MSSSIAISRAITCSALCLLVQRVSECVLYCYLKEWAKDKSNFKQLKVGRGK